MARRKQVTVNGIEYDLQSIPVSEYMKYNEKYGMTGNKTQNRMAYFEYIMRACIVSPKEVATNGMKYFDDNEDDINGFYALIGEIESFLGERKGSARSLQTSEA
ncbi:MAG: hypothetical protein LBK46_03785 [Oscillospiraceae bacterium]|jgi:hypothetical protein|nr:hypothetical protein [Oscillospiraceae bacterium]